LKRPPINQCLVPVLLGKHNFNISMKNRTLLAVPALAVGMLALLVFTQSALSQPTVIFSDDFNSYANDAALTAVWTRISGTSANIGLAPDPAAGGTRGQGIFETASSNVGRLQHVLSSGIVPTDANPIIFSFDLYDPNGGTTSGRDYAELRNSAGTGGLFDAGIYNGTQTYYEARNLDGAGWIVLATPRTTGWHTFELDINATTASLEIDGTVDANFNNLTWNGGTSYNWINLGSALSSSLTANFDNVSLDVGPVPEPSTALLSLLGGLCLIARSNRRRMA